FADALQGGLLAGGSYRVLVRGRVLPGIRIVPFFEPGMTAVAVRGIPRALATAQIGLAILFGGECQRRKLRAFVGTVAKRLISRTTAGTPVILLARLQL